MSKGYRNTLALAGALLIASFFGIKLSGCWDAPEFPDHPPRVEGEPTTADQPYYETMNEFAFRLAHELDFQGNALVSPLSLYQNLALLLNGAEGDTKTALEDVLGFSDVARQDLNDAQNRLINRYRAMDDRPVRLANGIFFVWPIVLEKGVVKGYEEWYNADIVKLGSAGVGAVRDLNRWAEEKTDGMIPKVVDKLDKGQIMLVLNALAFNAKWEDPFGTDDTREAVFHAPDGDVQVQMMKRFGGVEEKSADGYFAARLRYEGEELAMTTVMPDEGTSPAEWLSEFRTEEWSDFNEGWRKTSRQMFLPKFSFDDQIDLIPAVRALGGGALFDEPNDFRHLSSDLVGITSITRIEQFTFIDVNEEGTRAAAVTVSEATGTSEELRFDRPFVFFIHDLEADVILFIGVVNDPTK